MPSQVAISSTSLVPSFHQTPIVMRLDHSPYLPKELAQQNRHLVG